MPEPVNVELIALKEYFLKDLGWGAGDRFQSQIIFDFLCMAAKAAEGGVVLDAGAGYQRYKPFFRKSLYLAQEHPVAGAANKGIRSYDILCDVKKIPILDNSVDVVLSTTSLEHYRDPDSFFSEAYRVLKPGKSLWVYVPFAYPEHEVPFDFQRPTRFGLARWYENAGFERIDVSPMSSSISAATYLLEYAVDEEVARICGGRNTRFESDEIRALTKKFCAMANKLDNGPFKDTTLPIGWVSNGYKKGVAEPVSRQWASSEAFLKENALPIPGVRFEGSYLVYEC